jgi:ubiquinone/menaquinone biosynthesis C-methylase UbiE
MDTRTFLLQNLYKEAQTVWGEKNTAYLGRVADDWLETTGQSGSSYRIGRIRMFQPGATRILDMGAGCGTFVHFALAQGFDAYGVEPERWKLEVVRRKAEQYGYDTSTIQRIIGATGEALPFDSDSFDCVTTFQTLEHVQDVNACCAEMLRVTKPGGGIHIICPDYNLSTWEGHYRLPWLPGLRGKFAEWYLAFCKKPAAGLRTLQPVSAQMLRRIFASLCDEGRLRLRIVNVDYLRALSYFRLPNNPIGYILTRPVFIAHFLRMTFRSDYSAHLYVFVDEKQNDTPAKRQNNHV